MKITTLSRFVYYISFGLLFCMLGYTVYFLYNNFYKTIVQSEVVYLLQSQVSFKVVNINKWEKVKEKLEEKKQISEINLSNDPFSGDIK